jgi:hypothetical protein
VQIGCKEKIKQNPAQRMQANVTVEGGCMLRDETGFSGPGRCAPGESITVTDEPSHLATRLPGRLHAVVPQEKRGLVVRDRGWLGVRTMRTDDIVSYN